jgi:hypothetical protein
MEMPTPPSDYTPLRRRCAFGGSIPYQTTPSSWLQRAGPLAAGVMQVSRRNSNGPGLDLLLRYSNFKFRYSRPGTPSPTIPLRFSGWRKPSR